MLGLEQCDVGGDYHYPSIPGPAVYWPPCLNPPAYRWHQLGPNDGWADGWVPGHWNYRCGTHVRWLSAPNLVIEPFVPGAFTP